MTQGYNSSCRRQQIKKRPREENDEDNMKSIKKAVLRWRSNKKNSDIKRSRHTTLKQQTQLLKQQSDDDQLLLTSRDVSCCRPDECRISSFLNSSSSIATDFS